MSVKVQDNEVDIVIAALRSDLTVFLEEWRQIISRFHLIIVKDPSVVEDLQIPHGFDYQVYGKVDIEKVAGTSSINFFGHSCRYFGYLISNKKYVISIDDDCTPAKDSNGYIIDAVAQHLKSLSTPATPYFFNTLYDPYCPGADFVRGYPFSLREGVPCVLSCGLWLNLADYDAPTQAKRPRERNSHYVNAVVTVPAKAMLPISGINIGFNREVLGAALCPGFQLAREGKLRWETLVDIWSGMCAKIVCDHLGVGVKSGLPYVWRSDVSQGPENLEVESEGMKLLEEIVPFFQSIRLPTTLVTAEDCIIEIAAKVRERLGPMDAIFTKAADAMEEWVRLWIAVGSQSV